MNRKLLAKYIEMQIEQENIINPFYELLGTELTIYDAIWIANDFIDDYFLHLTEEEIEAIHEFALEKTWADFEGWHEAGIDTADQMAEYILSRRMTV